MKQVRSSATAELRDGFGKPNPIETCTIWVCVCCMLVHANGECCDQEHGDVDYPEPLSAIAPEDNITAGMFEHEHAADCLFNQQNPEYQECDCETTNFSWSFCEGCGSTLGGSRHAMTLWIGENA